MVSATALVMIVTPAIRAQAIAGDIQIGWKFLR
jgi:hypothetical protein